MHMRMHLAAAVILLYSSVALAAAHPKDYEWIDAKLIDITTEKAGAVVVPLVAPAGGPTTKTYYWIQTNETIYVLGPVLTRSRLLNVTLHGPTKLAIDGNNAHILDDYGKDEKLRIVQKIPRPKPGDQQ